MIASNKDQVRVKLILFFYVFVKKVLFLSCFLYSPDLIYGKVQ